MIADGYYSFRQFNCLHLFFMGPYIYDVHTEEDWLVLKFVTCLWILLLLLVDGEGAGKVTKLVTFCGRHNCMTPKSTKFLNYGFQLQRKREFRGYLFLRSFANVLIIIMLILIQLTLLESKNFFHRLVSLSESLNEILNRFEFNWPFKFFFQDIYFLEWLFSIFLKV